MMNVSYKWLQEYVDLSGISAEELAEKITLSGIEVDGVVKKSEGLKGVVIGHVLECEQHPNADKLNKCLVDIGQEEPVQIICGAPNVGKGQKVAVATVGAVLPGNFKIKRAKLRGEESHGMICSLQELGLEAKLVAKEYATGIFNFPQDAKVGEDALAALGLDDEVLELDLTPNRSDAMSMIGVAYEVAAILGREVKWPVINSSESTEKATDFISVKVEAPEDTPLYIAKVVKDIKVGPSPLWLQTRLMNAGIRPHNNVVDITNYILLEYGQPLHAFDYDRLGSKEIVVRRAKDAEKMTTLDETERTLSSEHLVITNGNVPVAVAGVMGGANSEVVEDTTTVIIEAAYFSGAVVRKASKDLGLRSESSARFEKGVDPERVRLAGERAAQLMVEYAGGTVLEGTSEYNDIRIEPAVVSITLDKINTSIGTNISSQEVLDIFHALKFEVKVEGETFIVTVPTRRGDITIEADLVEEVARLYGYDNIPSTLPVGTPTVGALTDYQQKRRIVRRALEGAGLYQATTYSLTSPKKAAQFTTEKSDSITLAMPMSEEHSQLRLSIIPQLLEVVKYNNARQMDSVALYEIGSVFFKENDRELPEEIEYAAGAITGLWESNPWQGEKKPVDFFVVKGIIEAAFEALGVLDAVEYRKATVPDMHPGRTAEVLLNGEVIGFVGQVHPSVQKDYDVKETYVFELSLEALAEANVDPIAYRMIPRYPSVTRDIALVVDKEIEAGQLQRIIVAAGGDLLKEIHLFDLYEGERMEEGKKSLAFSLKYFDPARTLTDEDITKAHDKVMEAVKEQAGAVLRS